MLWTAIAAVLMVGGFAFHAVPMPKHSLSIVSALMMSVLTACGGGGDGTAPASPVATAPTPNPAPTPAPAPASGQYRTDTLTNAMTAAQTVAQMNTQASQGYAAVAPVATASLPIEMANLYLDYSGRSATTLQYAADPLPGDATSFKQLLNTRGQQGFLFKGPWSASDGLVALLVKDSALTRSFSYDLVPVAADESIDSLLTLLNARGAQGWNWRGPYMLGTSQSHLFEQKSGGASFSYSAVLEPAGGATADFVKSTLSAQGAAGRVFLGEYLAGSQTAMLFKQDASRPAAITYTFDSGVVGETLSAQVARLNAHSANGEFGWGDLAVGATAQDVLHLYVSDPTLSQPLFLAVFP